MIETNNARAFRPMYPWVFVQVLDKEQKYGSIYMVSGKQHNKPTHEGLVLATWDPVIRPTRAGILETRTSELSPGDHVLFPHWCGQPVIGYDEAKYRVVRERDWSEDKQGGILGVIEDGLAEEDFTNKVAELVRLGDPPHVIVQEIMKHYVLIDKTRHSVTLSGL